MQQRIPDPAHRITLAHDGALNGTDEGFAQGQAQNARIVAFAREVGGTAGLVPVEVLYQRTDDPSRSSTEVDFDAVLVDTMKGTIVQTLPPYSEIDPDWEAKR
jgi:hypothetical protein